MSAFANKDELIDRLTGGNNGNPQHLFFWRDARVAGAAPSDPESGRLTSLWRYQGVPSAGVAPGAVAAPTRATDGALKQANPGGGRQLFLVGGHADGVSTIGTLILYDRLLHISGLSGMLMLAQTVGGTLTRYTGTASVGNEIWVEIYTPLGAMQTTISANYTDQDGNASTSQSALIGGTGLQNDTLIIPIPLAAGDTGVRGVTDVTLGLSTGAIGDFGITIARPLLELQLPVSGRGFPRNLFVEPPFIEILTDACLALAWTSSSAAPPQIMGGFTFVER